jgi:hypothetical protein
MALNINENTSAASAGMAVITRACKSLLIPAGDAVLAARLPGACTLVACRSSLIQRRRGRGTRAGRPPTRNRDITQTEKPGCASAKQSHLLRRKVTRQP